MKNEIMEDKIIARAHCDMRRWWMIFLGRCLLGMPFIIGSILVYHKFGFEELTLASLAFTLPMCLFILETLRHLKDRVVFYPDAMVIKRKKVILNKEPETYLYLSEGILGIWGNIYLGGRDVTYVENVRDLYFKTYMNYEELAQGDKTAIYNVLKRIIPAGVEYIPVYAFQIFKKRTINYAVGIAEDKLYVVPLYAGENLLGFKGYFIEEIEKIESIDSVELWGEHTISMYNGRNVFRFVIKDVMYGALRWMKNFPFTLDQQEEATEAMKVIKEWEKTKSC